MKSDREKEKKRRKIYSSKSWGKIRIMVLERDNFTCQSCGKYGNTVHHIKPISEIDDPFDMNNLVTYCFKCHGKEDGKNNMKDRKMMVDKRRNRFLEALKKRKGGHF